MKLFRLKKNSLYPCEELLAEKGRCALAIMTKAPVAGNVKTRLTPPLSREEAAALNICFLKDTATAIGRVGRATQGVACYTPVGAEASYAGIIPSAFRFIAQRGEHLSERLTMATQDLLQAGYAAACLIGSDSPMLTPAIFAEAAEVLAHSKKGIVLGPSNDGGYYLIGLKTAEPRVFEDIDWSTDKVLEQTLERAREAELPVHLLPTRYDVDDRFTLHQLCSDLFSPEESQSETIAPFTREFLDALMASEGRARIWPETIPT